MGTVNHQKALKEVQEKVFAHDWSKEGNPTSKDFATFADTLSDEEWGQIYGKKSLKARIARRKC